MRLPGWHNFLALALLLGFFLGCNQPSSSASPPLSATAAQQTLDAWNPNHCKVVEFYGFHKLMESSTSMVAYVLLSTPSDKAPKTMVYAARFQLLTPPEGRQQWFLISLINHSAGLTRRQGWDNLMIPVKEAAPPSSK
jgi:hypothetical protein